MFVCWSAKGGSGTTVVAAALALMLSRSRPTLLVDLAGDCPGAMGLPEPAGPGIVDWLTSPTADAAALARLAVPATDTLRLVPRGGGSLPARPRWADAADALASSSDAVVVDAGTGEPPAELAAAAASSLLVTRSCYLAIRRAVALTQRPHGIVLVGEPGRALGVRDIERAIGAPVVAEVPYDPAVARAVDAGLLAARLPRSLAHPLRSAA